MIDWIRVESVMRASITGRTLSPKDQDLCAAAYKDDPKKYRSLHGIVFDEERARINPFNERG